MTQVPGTASSVMRFAVPPGQRARYLGMAFAASFIHLAMLLPAYRESGQFRALPWLSILFISLLVSLPLFGFAVHRGETTTALLLSLMSLASILVFWAGLTLPLAVASIVIGLRRWKEPRRTKGVTWALAFSAISVCALVGVALGAGAASG